MRNLQAEIITVLLLAGALALAGCINPVSSSSEARLSDWQLYIHGYHQAEAWCVDWYITQGRPFPSTECTESFIVEFDFPIEDAQEFMDEGPYMHFEPFLKGAFDGFMFLVNETY